MKKIRILGNAGSGKSTLAKKLGEILNIEVFHLDKLFHDEKWNALPQDEKVKILKTISFKNSYIIDGWYFETSTLSESFESCDTFIHLDFNRFVCFFRHIRRDYFQYKTRIGVITKEKPPNGFDFIKWILFKHHKIVRPKMIETMNSHKNAKCIKLKNQREVDDFLIILGQATLAIDNLQ